MSWYSDGEPFDEWEPDYCKHCEGGNSKAECDRCLEGLNNMPTARPKGDVVEVVRCKDCRYYEKYPTWSACTYWSGDPYEQASVDDHDFCSYGERRGDDE